MGRNLNFALLMFSLLLLASGTPTERCAEEELIIPRHRWVVKTATYISGGSDVNEVWGIVRNFRQCIEECAVLSLCEGLIWDKQSWNCWLKHTNLAKPDDNNAVYVEDHISAWKHESTSDNVFEEFPNPKAEHLHINITEMLHISMRHQLLLHDGIIPPKDHSEPPCPDDPFDTFQCLAAGVMLPTSHPLHHLYLWLTEDQVAELETERILQYCTEVEGDTGNGTGLLDAQTPQPTCVTKWQDLDEKLVTLVNDMDEEVEVFKTLSDSKREVVFINDHERAVEVFFSWNDGVQPDISNGILEPGFQQLQNTYVGHKFYFLDPATGQRLSTHIVTEISCVMVTGRADAQRCKGVVGIPHSWVVASLPAESRSEPLWFPSSTHLWFKIKESRKQLRQVVVSYEPKLHQIYSATGRRPGDRAWLNVFPRIPITLPIVSIGNAGDNMSFVSPTPFWNGKLARNNSEQSGSANVEQAAIAAPTGESEKIEELPVVNGSVFSVRPRAVIYKNLFTEAEANHIIEQAERRTMRPSFVGTGTGEATADRKSSSTHLEDDVTPIVRNVSHRVYQALGMTPAQGKRSCELQIVHYPTGGIYKPHFDFFDPFPSSAGSFEEVQSGTNRFASVLLYLNTVAEGGGTVFPDLFGGAAVVRAELGSALVWYSALPNGNTDMFSRHGGLSVLQGDKWVSTFFCWDRLHWNANSRPRRPDRSKK